MREEDEWTERDKLLPSDGEAFDRFGSSMSVAGDRAVIGAISAGENGFGSGSAYAFVRQADTWTEQAKLLPSDGAAEDHFGASVSVSIYTAVIGVFPFSEFGEPNPVSGTAYAFDLIDTDRDGVLDEADACPETPNRKAVNPANGCSIAQMCPCAGPRGSENAWQYHRHYVSCVAQKSKNFLKKGLIGKPKKKAIVSKATASTCGRKKK